MLDDVSFTFYGIDKIIGTLQACDTSDLPIAKMQSKLSKSADVKHDCLQEIHELEFDNPDFDVAA